LEEGFQGPNMVGGMPGFWLRRKDSTTPIWQGRDAGFWIWRWDSRTPISRRDARVLALE
jgi:hypothetical protein